jgi:diphosphomevalonate decarboxylase
MATFYICKMKRKPYPSTAVRIVSLENRSSAHLKPVSAVAHANIALIKYWGKRSVERNLPAVGSVSLTLDALQTRTSVRLADDSDYPSDRITNGDVLILNGEPAAGKALEKVSAFADLMAGAGRNRRSGKRPALFIESGNNFPTGAGLASSASGFAALAKAFDAFFKLGLNEKELSAYARQGSGSAARSVYGGIAEMLLGTDESGYGDYAVQLYDENYWDIRLLAAVVSEGPKETGSTEGMNRTANTSPFYKAWVDSAPEDITLIKEALRERDFQKLGELAEHSAMKMHGLAISAHPSVLYWKPATLESIRCVWGLRKKGIPAYLTMDAGPQVKVITLPEYSAKVSAALRKVPGVADVIGARPGPGARLLSQT